jgi:hypothetical protein
MYEAKRAGGDRSAHWAAAQSASSTLASSRWPATRSARSSSTFRSSMSTIVPRE